MTNTDRSSTVARPRSDADALEQWLVDTLASLLGIDPASVDPHERFTHYGLDSAGALRLIAELGKHLDRPLPVTLLWARPTIAAMTAHLTGGIVTAEQPDRPRSGGDLADEPIAIVGIGMPIPRRGRSRGVLAPAPRWGRRDLGGPRRPLGRGRLLRCGCARAGQDGDALGWLSRAHRRVRCRVLRDLAARGDGDGSAATARARGSLGGARGRGAAAARSEGEPDGSVLRSALERLRRAPAARRRPVHHDAHGDRRALQHHRQSAVVRARAPGTEHHRRHGLLLVARRHPPRLPEPAHG